MSRIREFEENNRNTSMSPISLLDEIQKSESTKEKDLQKTIVRLTNRNQELERAISDRSPGEQSAVEMRSLEAELTETKQTLTIQKKKFDELKKTFEKEIKQSSDHGYASLSNGYSSDRDPFTDESDSEQSIPFKDEVERKEYHDINFKYLKHIILKYMCSSNDQSRQVIGVIGHMLQFTTRESSIVRDCMDWKLPLDKKKR